MSAPERTTPTSAAPMPASAMRHSVTNIMTADPTIVTSPVMIEATELLSVWESVSTSLDTRESVSPRGCRSK